MDSGLSLILSKFGLVCSIMPYYGYADQAVVLLRNVSSKSRFIIKYYLSAITNQGARRTLNIKNTFSTKIASILLKDLKFMYFKLKLVCQDQDSFIAFMKLFSIVEKGGKDMAYHPFNCVKFIYDIKNIKTINKIIDIIKKSYITTVMNQDVNEIIDTVIENSNEFLHNESEHLTFISTITYERRAPFKINVKHIKELNLTQFNFDITGYPDTMLYKGTCDRFIIDQNGVQSIKNGELDENFCNSVKYITIIESVFTEEVPSNLESELIETFPNVIVDKYLTGPYQSALKLYNTFSSGCFSTVQTNPARISHSDYHHSLMPTISSNNAIVGFTVNHVNHFYFVKVLKFHIDKYTVKDNWLTFSASMSDYYFSEWYEVLSCPQYEEFKGADQDNTCMTIHSDFVDSFKYVTSLSGNKGFVPKKSLTICISGFMSGNDVDSLERYIQLNIRRNMPITLFFDEYFKSSSNFRLRGFFDTLFKYSICSIYYIWFQLSWYTERYIFKKISGCKTLKRFVAFGRYKRVIETIMHQSSNITCVLYLENDFTNYHKLLRMINMKQNNSIHIYENGPDKSHIPITKYNFEIDQ